MSRQLRRLAFGLSLLGALSAFAQQPQGQSKRISADELTDLGPPTPPGPEELALRKKLSDPSPKVRAAAAIELGKRAFALRDEAALRQREIDLGKPKGEERTGDPIESWEDHLALAIGKLLRDPDVSVRPAAVRGLAAIADESKTLFASKVLEPDSKEDEESGDSLQQAGWSVLADAEDDNPGMLRWTLDEQEPAFVEAGGSATRQGERDERKLIGFLGRPDDRWKIVGIELLRRNCGLRDMSGGAFKAIRPFLAYPVRSVRIRAAYAVSECATESQVESLITGPEMAQPAFRISMLTIFEFRTREVTTRNETAFAPDRLDAFQRKMAADPDPEVATEAIEAYKPGDRKAPVDILKAALARPEARVRAAAMEAWGKTDPASAAEVLGPALSDPSKAVRESAAIGLADARVLDARFIEPLVRISAGMAVDTGVMGYLGEVFEKTGSVLTPNVIRWAGDPDPNIRGTAVFAARMIKDPKLLAVARKGASDLSPEVRTQAVISLEGFDPDPSTLAAMVHDKDRSVRLELAQVFLGSGWEPAKAILKQLAQDPDREVSIAARETLRDLQP